MKNTLKLFLLVTITTFGLALAGCSKKEEASTDDAVSTPAAETTASTSQAMYEQAKNYYSGANNTPVDKAKAFELFSKAAAQGDGGAMFFVGVMYETGEAGEQNDQKALEWFEKSDKAGCGAAAEWITKMKKKMKK